MFEHPVGSGQMVWLGNQWASGGGAVRNSDLLYWSLLRFDAAGDVLQFTWCALLCFFQLLWLVVCATAAVTGGRDARMAAEMGAVGVCGQVAELHNTDLKIASAPPMLRGEFEI